MRLAPPRVVASSLRPRRAEQGSAVSFAILSGTLEGRPAPLALPFTNTHTQTPPPTHTRKGGGMEIHVRSRLGPHAIVNAYFIHSHAPNTTSLPPPSLRRKTRFPHKLQMNIFRAYQQAHVHRGTATPGPTSVQFNVTMFIFVKNMFSLFTDLNGSIVPFTPTTHAPPAPPPPPHANV